MKMLISELREYPWNSDVYGEHSSDLQLAEMDELVADISQNGVLVKPVVDQDGFIIAGNRRIHALKILKVTEVEVEQYDFSDEMQRIAYLFSSNQYRTKTTEIKTREAMYLKTAHKKYAEALRRQKTEPEYIFDDETFRSLVGKEAMAKFVGIPERTLRKSEKVVKKLDELDAAGDEVNAKRLRDVLETNISGAEKMVDDWEKDEKREIEAAESNDLDELKEKTPPKKKIVEDPAAYDEDLYWYWAEMLDLTKKMRAAVSRFKNSPRYNHTTPISVTWIISNIIKVCEKFETWAPDKVGNCEVCGGTGTAGDNAQCDHCIQGKTGYYAAPTKEE